jgi:hypothetical protein
MVSKKATVFSRMPREPGSDRRVVSFFGWSRKFM